MEDIPFEMLVHNAIQDPYNRTILETIYNKGIRILLSIKNTDIAENILNQMIFLFPTSYHLYYYMGYIFKDTNISKALMWFQLCFQVCKENPENILDLIKLLFDNGYLQYIQYINKNHGYILDNHSDPRIRLQIASVYIKCNMLKTAHILFLKLLDELESTNSDLLLNAYINYTYLLSKTDNVNSAIDYYKKIFQYLDCQPICENEKLMLIILYHNYAVLLDYIYYDYLHHKQLCKLIHSLYIQTNEYSLRYSHIRTHRKIRIGYVSSDFYNHAVSNFIIPILENHNYAKYDIVIFSDKNETRLKNISRHSVHIQYFDTKMATDVIYNNNIDILIDLNGYTCGNRLDIFSKNPAPVQMTYLGYPNTLGLDFIKYRITDQIADHIDSSQYYSETLLRMQKCFLLFKNTIQTTPIIHTDIDTPTILLGALNKELKNSIHSLKVWGKILDHLPTSKILIKLDGIDNTEERLSYYMKQLDVVAERIILINHCSTDEYIQLFSRIDILLDTFPYSGTTTTCNALYNSVPVITLYNKNLHVHNVSSSLLINSGFPELVAYTETEYINKIIQLSKNRNHLSYYRENIHSKFMELMNPREFMKDYELLLEGALQDVYK